MNDSYVKIALARNKHVRIYVADTTRLCEDARLTHDLYPTSAAALGRLLSAATMMGLMLKEVDSKIVLQVNGKGPIGTMLAVAFGNGDVKGFVGDNTIYLKYNDTNKLAVGRAVGIDGYLSVTKTGIKNNFTGTVALQSGELGDDLAYYFMQSEQTPSIVSLGVLVDTDYSVMAAGGMIIQLMPNHTEEDIEYLENLLKDLKPISTMINEGKKPEEIINDLFDDAIIQDMREVKYCCTCSKEHFIKALSTLPLSDLSDLAKDETLDLKCEYCNKHYTVNRQDIEDLITYVENQRLRN